MVDEGLVKPGQYAANMIKTFEEVYGEMKRQKLLCAAEIQELDASNLIAPQDAAIYRSIVGMGIYLSQERLDIAYTIKELASKMSSPAESALQQMRKRVGYLKETDNQRILLPMCEKGYGVQTRSDFPWLLESFTDADWSGSKTRRSTSAAVHAINGVIVHTTSRMQKTVSLSSAESELHAIVAGACDGICLRYSLEFLTNQQAQHVCWMDSSATRQIACKRGSGKLRHVSGRLLWVKDKVAEGIMEVKAGWNHHHNLADVGTKPLGKNQTSTSFALVQCSTLAVEKELVLQEAENLRRPRAVEKRRR